VFLQLLTDASLPVVSEALNAIFDLFSEDNMYTQAIQQLNLLSQLSAFLPVFTQRVRTSMIVH
jgi:UTP:GlnB (protein PII) uridylyltransferase